MYKSVIEYAFSDAEKKKEVITQVMKQKEFEITYNP